MKIMKQIIWKWPHIGREAGTVILNNMLRLDEAVKPSGQNEHELLMEYSNGFIDPPIWSVSIFTNFTNVKTDLLQCCSNLILVRIHLNYFIYLLIGWFLRQILTK